MLRRIMLTATFAAVVFMGSAGQAAAQAGDVTARSAYVTVTEGCPSGTVAPGCKVTVVLRTTRGDGHRPGVLVGRATKSVAPGKQARFVVALNALGRRLLAHRRPLPLALTTAVTSRGFATTTTTPVACRPTGPPNLPTPGSSSTGIVGGIYLFGGPINPRSCTGGVGPTPPIAGIVRVLNVDGNIVATQTVSDGQTFTIPVPPGTYTAQASLGDSGSLTACQSDGQFTVDSAGQTAVEIRCNVP